MPLNGHSYLVRQGWEGQGKGLRHNAISKPLAIPQKKTLAGLGKDRDEAFPFWDHLFTLTSKAIQVKIPKEGESSTSDAEENSDKPLLTRTSTGLISNKRPVLGTPASSGTSTPTTSQGGLPRANLLSIAKRESARKGLYARFFQGPVLSPEILDEGTPASSVQPTLDSAQSSLPSTASVFPDPIAGAPKALLFDANPEASERSMKCNDKSTSERDEEKTLSKSERRQKKEQKRLAKAKGKMKEDAMLLAAASSSSNAEFGTVPEKSKKRKRNADQDETTLGDRKRREKLETGNASPEEEADIVLTKEERRRRKADKRRRKEERGRKKKAK